jgi:3-hydroxyisobutyrate dehydrogenase
MSAKAKIAFVGVGRMGANMARRLKECGYPITAVYDVHAESAQTLAAELGAKATTQLAEVTALADVIFTVVTDDAAMATIYENAGDNLLSGSSGKTFINCATIAPETHVRLMKLAQEKGAKMLEVPMASSIPQAREGKLFLMVAGEKDAYLATKPVLDDLSSSITYTGEAGTAASLKALVNMVMNINTAALAEGLGLAEALGLNLDMVRDVFSLTGANSRVLQTDGADMQDRDHDCYFSAAHAAKDSGIALALGKSQGLPMVLAEATKQQYDRMVEQGLGNLDKSGISELTFKSRIAEREKIGV